MLESGETNYLTGALTKAGLGIDEKESPEPEKQKKGERKMQQTKKLPKGYHVESAGTYDKLVHEESGNVIATVNLYNCEKQFRSENFLMGIYESPHWKALEAFYSNVYWENRRRKQAGGQAT